MLASSIPANFTLPFGSAAGVGYIRTVPSASQISITPGAASLTDGFPPLNFLPIASGGVPMSGKDLNGILNEITASIHWSQAGGLAKYDSSFSTAIGGYPNGSVLRYASGAGLWVSTVDNNTSNPDTGGANWIGSTQGRLLNVQTFTSSGTYTPTSGTNKVIVEAVGGGGGGGGSVATGSNTVSMGCSGGSGSYGQGLFTSAFSGVTVTVGAAGASCSAAGTGGTGGTSSFGALLSCPGGVGGLWTAPAVPPMTTGYGAGGSSPSGANIKGTRGASGNPGVSAGVSSGFSGAGASSVLGSGGTPIYLNAPQAGISGSGYGAGGSGGSSTVSQSGYGGASGSPGIVIVYEYS